MVLNGGMIRTAIRYALEQVAAPEGRTLLLNGEPDVAAGDVYQTRHDFAQASLARGRRVFSEVSEVGRDYAAVFVQCPKQREEAEGLLALALDRSRGFVMAVAHNDAGGSRLRKMLEAYGAPVETASKSHCRVVWTLSAPKASRALIDRHLAQLEPRQIVLQGKKWWTVPGLFSWDEVDAGSRFLAEHLPSDLSGDVADFGCGYGFLCAEMAERFPAIDSIEAYDIDARAVACCARNGGKKVKAIWQDITTLQAPGRFDAVIMNPPFHAGKEESISLGHAFIEKAGECLKRGGRLFLVANRHLPYERALAGHEILQESGPYKILTAVKA